MERPAMMFRTCKECYEEASDDVQASAAATDWCERRQRRSVIRRIELGRDDSDSVGGKASAASSTTSNGADQRRTRCLDCGGGIRRRWRQRQEDEEDEWSG
ncbi:hypothetical protein Scep_027993 [Stephania cephalantha]|uniref:Uncharacterized protein n=1 Tax=Stephania cephalantha TaxID=152367 RepID=A0AAP0E928_9MAGN